MAYAKGILSAKEVWSYCKLYLINDLLVMLQSLQVGTMFICTVFIAKISCVTAWSNKPYAFINMASSEKSFVSNFVCL